MMSRAHLGAILLSMALTPSFAFAQMDDAAPQRGTVEGVQIGAQAPERGPVEHLRIPLNTTVTIRIADGTFQEFFLEMSRQANLYFILVGGIGSCRVQAFADHVSAREALGLTLTAPGMTYQQSGKSNTYVIVPRQHDRHPCPASSVPRATGTCESEGKPISIRCKDAPLGSLTERLHAQSGANIFVWGAALDYPVDVDIRHASLKKTLKKLQRLKGLRISDGPEKGIGVSLRQNDSPSPAYSLQTSTQGVLVSPDGIEDPYVPNHLRRSPRGSK